MSRNGSALPDARAELTTASTEATFGMKTGVQKSGDAGKRPGHRGGRRPRVQATAIRYFVGRTAEDGKPALEQEVMGEPEALVIAFKNDSRVYFVSEYRVTERIEDGQVRLEKEPALFVQRVLSSTQVE